MIIDADFYGWLSVVALTLIFWAAILCGLKILYRFFQIVRRVRELEDE